MKFFKLPKVKMQAKAIVTWVLLFTSISVCAQTDEQLKDINAQLLESINLLKEKQYARACVKLKLLPALTNTSTNAIEKQLQINIHYLQGQCFSGLGLYDEAKEYFNKVIQEDPEQPRPYLDLAIIYQYLGEFESAERIYERVLNLPTLNDEVRTKINKMRGVNPEKLSYSLELSFGALIDDNVINAPTESSFIIYDNEFMLSDNLRPTQTQGAFVGVKGAVDKLLSNDNRISASLNVETTLYPEESKGDTLLVDLVAGYQKKVGESEYAIEPRYASVSLGGEVLLNVTAISARYTTFVSNNVRLSPILEYSSYSYTSDSERDVTFIKPQLLANYTYSPEIIFNALWYTTTGDANKKVNSYDSTVFEIGGKYKFDTNLILEMDYRVNSMTYAEVLQGFNRTRKDNRTSFNVNASYNFRPIGFERVTLDIGINSYDNSSNIELYDHSRTQYYAIAKYVVF